MIPIAPGRFVGARPICDPGSLTPRFDPVSEPDRIDVSQVVSAYSIDRRVVSCEELKTCIDAGACTGDTHTCSNGAGLATLDDASRYCKWRDGRLPTFQEWQRAARSTDGRRYPNGGEWNPEVCERVSQTLPESHVKTDPACRLTSPDGMIYTLDNVNAFEWTSDTDCFEGGSETYRRVPIRVSLETPTLTFELLSNLGPQGEFRCAKSK